MSIVDRQNSVTLVRGENERHVGAIARSEVRRVEHQIWANLNLRSVN